LELEEQVGASFIQVKVKDDGCGIKEEDQ